MTLHQSWPETSAVEKRNVICPELMFRRGAQRLQQRDGGFDCWNRARIGTIAQNPHRAIQCDRARRPPIPAVGTEPLMGGFMVNMPRIEQGNQNVDIRQRNGHSSSRSLFTSSMVALFVPDLNGS